MMTGFATNLIELGHFAAFLALAVALVQAFAPMVARRLGVHGLAELSVNSAHLVMLLLSLGGAALLHAFATGNFSVLYVAQNSNSQLPMFYRITALWGGHEGSLYLWAWVLAAFTAVLALQGRRKYPQRLPAILSVQGFLMIGFLGLILFLSNPFDRLLPAPVEGRDLNPLLQDPGMAFHPPMLYLGYVGFSVPFAFAIAALVTRWDSELWVGLIRRWALIAWTFLTVGIMLGGWWAYYELGWGGYWAWDPVENASFMPWLLGTALIHSVTVQEHRRMLHTWNLFLVITTFALSLLGTFLVRSGVLSSVHAFAVDPGRGLYILLFMTAVLGVSFALFLIKGRQERAQEAITSTLSRESLFVGNNVLFTVACVCVMLGTLYPLALEAFTGAKITVGAPYFNAVMVPMFLLVLLLMGFGPLVPWRKVNRERLWQRIKVPAIAAVVTTAVATGWLWPVHWTAPVAVLFITFVVVNLGDDLLRNALRRRRRHGENPLTALLRTVLRNRRFYGGMVVHLGIAVIATGLVGSGLFREEVTVLMKPGDVVELGGERLQFDGTSRVPGANYLALQARFKLLGSDVVLRPERRRYPVQEAPTTEASIDSSLWRDVYVVIGEALGDKWTVIAYYNPLVQFIWLGGVIILFGIVLTLSQRRRQRSRAPVPAGVAGAGA